MPFSIVDSQPDCVATNVAPADGTVAPFENCTDFFTFGVGGSYAAEGGNPFFGDASAGTLILTVIGFIVMILALIQWVRLEHSKATAQAARLRRAAAGLGTGSTAPAPGMTADDPRDTA